jgi:hypothetical protein
MVAWYCIYIQYLGGWQAPPASLGIRPLEGLGRGLRAATIMPPQCIPPFRPPGHRADADLTQIAGGQRRK